MQKQLVSIKYYLKKQEGFLFPYITFITALLLLSVISSIALYSNDKKMTELQLEQIELETLQQIGLTEFKNSLSKRFITDEEQSVTYFYPNGKVNIVFYQNGDKEIICIIKATTLKANNKTRVYFVDTS